MRGAAQPDTREANSVTDEHDDLDDDSEEPARSLDELRARLVARRRSPPDDGLADREPFTDDEIDQIIEDTVNQHITTISRASEDGTWLRLTYLMRGIKLIEFSMGAVGNDKPLAELIISNYEAHDMIAKIIAAIGPDDRPAPDPDPAPRPGTQW
jgi:hypothetical protein